MCTAFAIAITPDDRERRDQRGRVDAAGVEDRDHDDRADVVDDREREQQRLQPG